MIHVAGHMAYDYLFSIDDFPSPNASCYVSDYNRYFGGAAGNTAYACAKLGQETSIISVVGGDFSGSDYERFLRKNGVGTKRIRIIKKMKTPRAYMFVEPRGNFLSFFYWGAGKMFPRLAVPKLKLEEGDMIHIATGHPDFNVRVSEYGNISFDPSYDTPLYGRIQLKRILKNTKLLFCNRHEMGTMRRILGNSSPLDHGAEVVVMSEGSGGTVVKTRNYSIRVKAVKTNVVDTVGAGDAHHAGFICAYLKGESLKRCAQIASSVASFVIEKRGAQTNLPSWKQAIARLK